jgi:cell division septal protein FtsQ
MTRSSVFAPRGHFLVRELNLANQKPITKNRFKKQRRKIDLRALVQKSVRIAAALVVTSLVALVLFELYGFMGKTTFLRLEQIDVKGCSKVTREEILSIAAVKVGDDLLGLKIPRMGEQLAKNPWVAGVTVRRYFPHSLAIEIVERKPVGIVSMGYLYYLDSHGEIFKPLQEGDRLDFPVITGLSEEELQHDPAGAKETLKGVLALVEQLGKGSPGITLQDISEIHYDKGFGYTLFTMKQGLPIRLGMVEFSQKLERLAKIYQDLQAQMPQLEYIDLDYSDRIVVKKV